MRLDQPRSVSDHIRRELHYRTAFDRDLAPIDLVMSRQRLIVDCNRQLLEMFGAAQELLVGQGFKQRDSSGRARSRPCARGVAD